MPISDALKGAMKKISSRLDRKGTAELDVPDIPAPSQNQRYIGQGRVDTVRTVRELPTPQQSGQDIRDLQGVVTAMQAINEPMKHPESGKELRRPESLSLYEAEMNRVQDLRKKLEERNASPDLSGLAYFLETVGERPGSIKAYQQVAPMTQSGKEAALSQMEKEIMAQTAQYGKMQQDLLDWMSGGKKFVVPSTQLIEETVSGTKPMVAGGGGGGQKLKMDAYAKAQRDENLPELTRSIKTLDSLVKKYTGSTMDKYRGQDLPGLGPIDAPVSKFLGNINVDTAGTEISNAMYAIINAVSTSRYGASQTAPELRRLMNEMNTAFNEAGRIRAMNNFRKVLKDFYQNIERGYPNEAKAAVQTKSGKENSSLADVFRGL